METAGVQYIKQINLIISTFKGLFRGSKIALTKELIRFSKNAYGDYISITTSYHFSFPIPQIEMTIQNV